MIRPKTGNGMKQEHRDKSYEAIYFTTNLSIKKKIIDNKK